MESIETLRHSAAHIMAAAVRRGFGNDTLFDIGPATSDGFYYDFDLAHRLSVEDFARIETEMQKIIAANLPFERIETTRAEAEKLLAGQRYKLERLADIPEGEAVTFYRCADFIDLCRGPHVATTGCVKAVKITAVAGSYFRGKETNPMLQRLYGMAAATQAELDAELARIEEAKKRDHRKLGRELDLFSIHDDVGPGLAHWHPKGARIRVAIEDYWRREHFRAGYEMIFTPHIGRAKLWETSGHLGFYRDGMFPPMNVAEEEGAQAEPYFVRAKIFINNLAICPHGIAVSGAFRVSFGQGGGVEEGGGMRGRFRLRGGLGLRRGNGQFMGFTKYGSACAPSSSATFMGGNMPSR